MPALIPIEPFTHPRLFFTADDLPRLRETRQGGLRSDIWRNLIASADWCLEKTPRTEWIPPTQPDPIYLNLYNRFYAMMHDMAITEHLAFAATYSDEALYRDAAIRWLLAACRVWKHEADGEPDQNKAYAALRILKGLAVGYDLLYHHLPDDSRREVRETISSVGGKYYHWYRNNPGMGAAEQNKHHASVEVASFGVAALALLSDVPEARDWVELATQRHTGYLLPHALTPSGTQEQSSNFWASTMQYRIMFMDALRRVTGVDLFKQFAPHMDGRIALAAVAGPKVVSWNENNQSILFAPSYGQLDYWSPVLVFLAREYRRPTYQYLAHWDPSLGALQQTRYITPDGEQLLFSFGGYAYAWYDANVPAEVEPDLPLSFLFADVQEAYARANYATGGIIVAQREDMVIVYASARPLLVEILQDTSSTRLASLVLKDDGTIAEISSTGGRSFAEQSLTLVRPSTFRLRRLTDKPLEFWCKDLPEVIEHGLRWPDGTRIMVVKGSLANMDPEGFADEKIVGMGKLKCIDPWPRKYPRATIQLADGEIVLEGTVAGPERRAR